MIFPSKHLMLRESLFWLWTVVVKILNKPKSIDRIWKDFENDNFNNNTYISFDDLILTLNYLYMIWIIEIVNNNKIKLCN